MNDREIIDVCINENKPERLISEYYSLFFLIIRETLERFGIQHTYQDIEDIRHEIFFNLMKSRCKKLKLFNPERAKLSTWLKIVVRRATISIIRKQGYFELSRKKFQIPVDQIEGMVFQNDAASPIEKEKRMEKLFAALEDLSERDKYVLKQKFFEMRSLDEIADSIGTKKQTTYQILSRAKKRLKLEIQKIGFTD